MISKIFKKIVFFGGLTILIYLASGCAKSINNARMIDKNNSLQFAYRELGGRIARGFETGDHNSYARKTHSDKEDVSTLEEKDYSGVFHNNNYFRMMFDNGSHELSLGSRVSTNYWRILEGYVNYFDLISLGADVNYVSRISDDKKIRAGQWGISVLIGPNVGHGNLIINGGLLFKKELNRDRTFNKGWMINAGLRY
ncbi:hypothetical protein ACFL1R_09430 [Candidatus Latescibacterota bacterium]